MKHYIFAEFHRDQKDIPFFHALRTFSIIMVIANHVLLGYVNSTENIIIHSLTHNVLICMDILFFLSGYFISISLLKQEINKNNLINFYKNRLIRIIPTFYIAILIYWYVISQEHKKLSKLILIHNNESLLQLYNALDLSLKYIWGDFLLISNYLPARIVEVGWAISVTVHFYIIIPFLILIAKKLFKNYRIFFWLLLYILSGILRLYHYNNNFFIEKIYYMTHTRFDSFVMGILLAEFNIYYLNAKKITIPLWIKSITNVVLLIDFLVILLGTYWKIPIIKYVFKYNWYNISLFLLGINFILFEEKKDWFQNFFSFHFYTPLSKISYSIFIYHQFIMSLLLKNFKFIKFSPDSSLIFTYLFILIGSFVFGWFFYLIFEKPFYLIRIKLNTK